MLTLYRRPQSPAFSRDPFFQLVDRFFNDVSTLAPSAENAGTPASWTPAMDLVENENAFVASVDLPGLTKDDIKISVEDGVLSISGERTFERSEEADDKTGFRRFERSFGSFHRSLTLPQGIEQENISAAFENGVLNLTLPKSEVAQTRIIDIA